MGTLARAALVLSLLAGGCGEVVKIDFDAGPTCQPLEAQMLPGPGVAVWESDTYTVAWNETRDANEDIYVDRLDAAGARIGPESRVTDDPAASRVLSLVATDTGHGVLWDDDRAATALHELYAADLDNTSGEVLIGQIFGSDVPAADKSSSILVWSGTHYATAWVEDRDDTGDPEVYFARWLPDGTKEGEDVRINVGDAAARDATLVRILNGYGLAWSDTRDAAGDGSSEIYFARLDDEGVRIAADDQRVTEAPGFSVRPGLAWNGTDFGIAWVDNRDGDSELYFARLDAAGIPIGDPVRMTEDPSPVDTKETPRLVWTGTEFALAWSDRRAQEGPANQEVYLARLDESGVRIGEDRRITESDTDSRATSLLVTGETTSIVWEELHTGGEREGWIASVCPEAARGAQR